MERRGEILAITLGIIPRVTVPSSSCIPPSCTFILLGRPIDVVYALDPLIELFGHFVVEHPALYHDSGLVCV